MPPKQQAATDLAALLALAAQASPHHRPRVFAAPNYETAERAGAALTAVGVVAYPVTLATGPGLALGTRDGGFSWD